MRAANVVGVAGIVLLAACGEAVETTDDSIAVTTTIAVPYIAPGDYPDQRLRSFLREIREPRAVAGSAMPPRHLDEVSFPDTLVVRTQIVPGGPPPDGIPSIDDPSFLAVDDVDFLVDNEAVIVLVVDDSAPRVYPVQIMMWHEIVNDVVEGEPVTVTYCPLCNSAVAYRRTVDGTMLDFGTSGYVYQSGMVMYDRQTESLWTHFDGHAVVGTLMGAQLERLPVQMLGWGTARDTLPDALVLDRDAIRPKPYGTSRYAGYDQRDAPMPGWFVAEIPDVLSPMTRVVGMRTDAGEVAVPRALLAESGFLEVSIGELPIVVVWEAGLNSPLQSREVADGDDIGSAGAFVARHGGVDLQFETANGALHDVGTGSRWNVLGHAVDGPLVGAQLEPVDHVDTFWFAWAAHHPMTDIAR